jgi:hypothetical protein
MDGSRHAAGRQCLQQVLSKSMTQVNFRRALLSPAIPQPGKQQRTYT